MATEPVIPTIPTPSSSLRENKNAASDATAASKITTGEPETFSVDGAVDASDPVAAKTLKKRELLDRVAKTAGVRPGVARDVFEATLSELGAAFSAGETIFAPPFGKARVNRQRDNDGGEVIILKLRRRAVQQNDGKN